MMLYFVLAIIFSCSIALCSKKPQKAKSDDSVIPIVNAHYLLSKGDVLKVKNLTTEYTEKIGDAGTAGGIIFYAGTLNNNDVWEERKQQFTEAQLLEEFYTSE